MDFSDFMPAANVNTPSLYLWLGAALITFFAAFAALVVHRIGKTILHRVTRGRVILSTMLQAIDRPAQWVLVLFALQIAWKETSRMLPSLVVLRDIGALALIGVLTWFSVCLVGAVGEAIVQTHPIDGQDNLRARRLHTQARVLARIVMVLIIVIGVSSMLMTFPSVRQLGASLLASAGVIGLIAGIAARPVLSNLIAGLQIALTQPIRLDDVVVIEGEWGRIEELAGSYVVVRIWDQRRLIVPLQWFIEHPFQNWTHKDSQITGSIFLWVDYRMPLKPLREELTRLCNSTPEWDHRVQVLQVTDTNERAMQLRILVSSADSARNWDLRCKVREGLLEFIQQHYPAYLPCVRMEQKSS